MTLSHNYQIIKLPLRNPNTIRIKIILVAIYCIASSYNTSASHIIPVFASLIPTSLWSTNTLAYTIRIKVIPVSINYLPSNIVASSSVCSIVEIAIIVMIVFPSSNVKITGLKTGYHSSVHIKQIPISINLLCLIKYEIFPFFIVICAVNQ